MTDRNSTSDNQLNEANEALRATYLGMAQNIIARMGNCSTAIKASCIALIAGMFVFFSDCDQEKGAYLALLLIPFFLVCLLSSMLDARYLQQERRYRALYDSMLNAPGNSFDKSMRMPKTSCEARSHFGQCYWSWSIIGFYVPVFIVVFVTFVVWCVLFG